MERSVEKYHIKKCAITLLGSFILAFGLYHVHSISGVTEGGVLGQPCYWSIGPAFLRR